MTKANNCLLQWLVSVAFGLSLHILSVIQLSSITIPNPLKGLKVERNITWIKLLPVQTTPHERQTPLTQAQLIAKQMLRSNFN